MTVKCKDCKYYVDQIGCGTYYPPAKCSGEITRECADFVKNGDLMVEEFKKEFDKYCSQI